MSGCPYCGNQRFYLLGDFMCGRCKAYWKPRTGEFMMEDKNHNWREVPEGYLVVMEEVGV